MTTTHPTYTLVLTPRSDRTWSAEPVRMTEVPGFRPAQAGPQGCYRQCADLGELIHHQARQAIADALGCDYFGFDLRFCLPTGQCVARSEILHQAVHPEADWATTVLVYVVPGLAEQVPDVPLQAVPILPVRTG